MDDSGQVFVSGGDDAVLRVFDLRAMAANNETGSPVGCFPGHKCGITYIDSKVQRADGQRYRKGIIRHETYARISRECTADSLIYSLEIKSTSGRNSKTFFDLQWEEDRTSSKLTY